MLPLSGLFLTLAACKMFKLKKKKGNRKDAQDEQPISFVNALNDTNIPIPNQNLNPDRSAVVMMANTPDDEDEENPENEEKYNELKDEIEKLKNEARPVFLQSAMKVRKFSGNPKENIDVNEWIVDFKSAAAVNGWVTNAQKLNQIKHHLEGNALSWLRATFGGILLQCDPEEVFKGLQTQFDDARPTFKYISQIKDLKQREDESVPDYYYKMIGLLAKANIDLESPAAVDHVITGLKPRLAQKVYGDPARYRSCEELFKRLKLLDEAEAHRRRREDDTIMAADVEDDHSEVERQARRPPDRQRFTAPTRQPCDRPTDRRNSGPRQTDQSPSRFNPRTFSQADRSDNWRNRSADQTRRVQFQPSDVCWRCGAAGHWSSECQSNRPYTRQGNAQMGPHGLRAGPSGPRGGARRWSALQQGRP